MLDEAILYGGRVVEVDGIKQADLWIRGGKVAGVLAPGSGEALAELRSGVRRIPAKGLYILPGLIDVHVHLREPGLVQKEDLSTGTAAAACGGVTTVLDMPNTVPPVATREQLEEKLALADGRIHVDVGFYGVVGVGNLPDIVPLASAGAIAFKLFLGPTTGDIQAPDRGALYEALQEVARTRRTLVVHAEDREVIAHWEAKMRRQGDSYGHFLQSRPAYGEAIATELAVRLAEETGVELHVAHIATREGLAVLRAAKQRGSTVTGETCPHYLGLTEADWPRLGNRLKILPPVRSAKDQKALWQAVRERAIDMIATDHAPHLDEERGGKGIWEAPAGAPGVETMLPLLLEWSNRGRLSLPDVVRLTSAAPAARFGLWPQKGSLQPGADADFVLVDPTRTRVIEGRSLHSKAKTTPFEGFEVQGIPVATYVRGVLVASEGALTGVAPQGRVLQPARRAHEV